MDLYFRKLLNKLHRKLGESRLVVRLAIHVRNQCRCIISYYLGGVSSAFENGEAWLLEQVAPGTQSFVDVGANVGNWTDLYLQHCPYIVKALLFDPSESANEALRRRFEDQSSLEVIHAAVGMADGQATLFEEPNSGEMSSLVQGVSNPNAVEKRVRVVTLDEEIKLRSLNYVDFLKVDAEGYDLYVLRGASDLLASQKIGYVQFEYNSSWALANSTLAAALAFLGSVGYHVFLLRPGRLVNLDYKLYGEYFNYSNYVAVSPDKLHTIEQYIKTY